MVKGRGPSVCLSMYFICTKFKGGVYVNDKLHFFYQFQNVLMLAAGTGIAPMIPIIRCILDNEEDMTFVHLVYCCKTYEDILCKTQLNKWTDHWNFNCKYVLSQVSTVTRGNISRDLGYNELCRIGALKCKMTH